MMDRLDERWHRCKLDLSRRVSPEDAATWLPGLELHDVQPHRIVLGGIPNSFFRTRIARRYQPLILESLRASFPDVCFASQPALELQVEAPPTPERGARAVAAHAEPHRATLSAGLADAAGLGEPASAGNGTPGVPTLDDFLAAPGNAEALHFARQVLEQPGQRFNPLLVVGESGLGKTHLLQAIAVGLRGYALDAPVLYVSGEAFKNEVLDAITRKRMPALREHYRSAAALLLDDLDFLLISPKAQEELLHTFDVLHRGGRQLVFAAQRFPRALPGLNEALRSRLEMGLVAELAPPDAEARRTLVLRRAHAAGLTLSADVAELLATRITRNLRRLEGAVIRLGAYAALHGHTISLDFAAQYAAPFFDAQPGPGSLLVSQEAIVERVADRFGITVRALKGRSRSPTLAGARRIAVHLLKELGKHSYSEIGAMLGNRSHSTMVHAHQTLREDLARNDQLERLVQQLSRSLVPQ